MLKKFSDDRVVLIAKEQEKMENLIKEIMEIATIVQNNSEKTKELTSQLDTSIYNSLDKLEIVSSGNELNAKNNYSDFIISLVHHLAYWTTGLKEEKRLGVILSGKIFEKMNLGTFTHSIRLVFELF